MTMTLISKMRFCCYLYCFDFPEAVKIQLRAEMETKNVAFRGVKSVPHLSGRGIRNETEGPSEAEMYLLRKRWMEVE